MTEKVDLSNVRFEGRDTCAALAPIRNRLQQVGGELSYLANANTLGTSSNSQDHALIVQVTNDLEGLKSLAGEDPTNLLGFVFVPDPKVGRAALEAMMGALGLGAKTDDADDPQILAHATVLEVGDTVYVFGVAGFPIAAANAWLCEDVVAGYLRRVIDPELKQVAATENPTAVTS